MDRSSPSRFPTWAKCVGWLVVGLWAITTLVAVARWWMMKSAHLRVQSVVAAGPKPMAAPGPGGADAPSTAASSLDPNAPPGTPARALPLIGPVLSGDVSAYTALESTHEEINDFLKGLWGARKQGLWSFKAWVTHLGLEGAETMTEELAAAEFLRRAGRFDDFLRQWQEALALGPWDFAGLEMFRSPGPHTEELRWNLLFRLSTTTQGLWGLLAQAAWRTGDSETASSHWQAMIQNADRSGDAASLVAAMVENSLLNHALKTADAGMRLGGWSDEQLASFPAQLGTIRTLHTVRHGLDGEKRLQESWLQSIGTANNPLTESMVSEYNSATTNFFNSLAIALTSRQQIEDNIAMLHHSMDQPLAHFDLRTGILQSSPPTPHEAPQHASLSWFDKYYLQYSLLAPGGLAQGVPQIIVRSQSEVDQTRLAAAVELHHRTTGHYPESLDDVADSFPDGPPTDPATGDSYLYQRTGDTGYRLWGRGVDRADNDGDRRSDVLWEGAREPSP